MFERETETEAEYINDISIINSGSFKLNKQIDKILGDHKQRSKTSMKKKKEPHQLQPRVSKIGSFKVRSPSP